jgi:hypothetical protein
MSDHTTQLTNHNHRIEARTPPPGPDHFPDDRPSGSTLPHPAVSLCESTDFLGRCYLDTLRRFQRVSGHLRGH